MTEKPVEDEAMREARRRGGVAVKLVAFQQGGFPDRTILLPDGRIGFLELKKAGEKPEPLQHLWLRSLRALGFAAGWADTQEGVRAWFAEAFDG